MVPDEAGFRSSDQTGQQTGPGDEAQAKGQEVTESRTLSLALRKWPFITHKSGFGSIWSIFRRGSIWTGDTSSWVLSDKGHQTDSVLKVYFSWPGKTLVLASGWEPRPPN